MKGLVIKSTGSSYIVRMDDGTSAECHIKGNFRIRGIRSTNPVAVGDYVNVQSDNVQSDKGQGTKESSVFWITEVEERRNYIIRRSTNLSKESHILAANIDQVALIVTVNHPVTSTTFIDRFLATCEAYSVPAILIFNKTDLLTKEETEQLNELRALYESIGYPTLAISALALGGTEHISEGRVQNTEYTSEGRVQSTGLFALLQDKVTLLSGNSGVGKSTLLNALFGKEITRTGKISDAHDKGMHTTTFSEMYNLTDAVGLTAKRPSSEGGLTAKQSNSDSGLTGEGGQPVRGWLIDTPGIKGFGSVDMQKEEVGHYFREIFRVGRDCRFGNCTHTNEPGCAVQEAVVRGDIAVSRFESYMSLLGDCTEAKYR